MRYFRQSIALASVLIALSTATASSPAYILAPIHQAAESGDIAVARKILDADPSLLEKQMGVTRFEYCKDYNHWDSSCTRWVDYRPCYVAASAGQLSMLKFLVGRGANISAGLNSFPSAYPLYGAIRNGRIAVVEYLLSLGANSNLPSSVQGLPGRRERWDGITGLHVAVGAAKLAIADLLIRKGAKLNPADAEGNTPLHAAVMRANLPIVQLLVISGADISAKNKRGRTARELAEQELSNDGSTLRYPRQQILTIMTDAETGKIDRARRSAIHNDLTRLIDFDISASEANHLVEEAITTADGYNFRSLTERLAVAGDARVIEIIDRRLFDFDSSIVAAVAPLITRFSYWDAGVIAKKWLTIDYPSPPANISTHRNAEEDPYHQGAIAVIRISASLLLLKGETTQRETALATIDRLLTLHNDILPSRATPLLEPLADALLNLHEIFPHQIACRLAKADDPNREKIELMRKLLLNGCDEALAHIFRQLDRKDSSATSSTTTNGATRTSQTSAADYYASELSGTKWNQPNDADLAEGRRWMPPGLVYDIYSPVEVKSGQRELIKAWLRKKLDALNQLRTI